MPFKELPDGQGLIWEPDKTQDKKHPCKDCFACQYCPDARCELCLKKKNGKKCGHC